MKNWFSVEMKSIFFQFRLKLHFSLLQTKLLLSLHGQNFDYTVINIVMNLFKVSNKRHRTTSIDYTQVSLFLNLDKFSINIPRDFNFQTGILLTIVTVMVTNAGSIQKQFS